MRRLLIVLLFGLILAGGATVTWQAMGKARLVEEALTAARALLARAGGFETGQLKERLRQPPTEAGLAITAGATGYLPLTAAMNELRRALASIQAGTTYWTPPLAAAVLVGLRSCRLNALVGDEAAAQLRVLLHLLRQGWSLPHTRRALHLDDQTTQQLLIAARQGLW